MFIGFLSVKPQSFWQNIPGCILEFTGFERINNANTRSFLRYKCKKTGIKQLIPGISLPKTRVKHIQNSRNKATLLLKITLYRGKCRQKRLLYMTFMVYLHCYVLDCQHCCRECRDVGKN